MKIFILVLLLFAFTNADADCIYDRRLNHYFCDGADIPSWPEQRPIYYRTYIQNNPSTLNYNYYRSEYYGYTNIIPIVYRYNNHKRNHNDNSQHHRRGH